VPGRGGRGVRSGPFGGTRTMFNESESGASGVARAGVLLAALLVFVVARRPGGT